MNKVNYPYIALGLGAVFMMMLAKGSVTQADGSTFFPLFTLLMISELAFFITASGAYVGVKKIVSEGVRPLAVIAVTGCLLLSAGFIWWGVTLWPSQ